MRARSSGERAGHGNNWQRVDAHRCRAVQSNSAISRPRGPYPGVICGYSRNDGHVETQIVGEAADKDRSRIWSRGLRLQPCFQSEHRVPAVLLHRCGGHLRCRGGHHVLGGSAVGCVRRSTGWTAGRPDDDPVGEVPAVHHVRRGPVAVHELPHLPSTGELRRRHEARLRLRHVRDLGSPLLAGQHPVRLIGFRGHPVGA